MTIPLHSNSRFQLDAAATMYCTASLGFRRCYAHCVLLDSSSPMVQINIPTRWAFISSLGWRGCVLRSHTYSRMLSLLQFPFLFSGVGYATLRSLALYAVSAWLPQHPGAQFFGRLPGRRILFAKGKPEIDHSLYLELPMKW